MFQGDLSVTSELLVGKHQGWIMSTMPGPEGSHCGPWTALGPVTARVAFNAIGSRCLDVGGGFLPEKAGLALYVP